MPDSIDKAMDAMKTMAAEGLTDEEIQKKIDADPAFQPDEKFREADLAFFGAIREANKTYWETLEAQGVDSFTIVKRCMFLLDNYLNQLERNVFEVVMPPHLRAMLTALEKGEANNTAEDIVAAALAKANNKLN